MLQIVKNIALRLPRQIRLIGFVVVVVHKVVTAALIMSWKREKNCAAVT